MSSLFGGETDIWGTDSDGGADSDYEQNDTPPSDIDEKLRNDILNIKHTLYHSLINQPDDKEDNLKDYMSKLNKLYVMSIQAQSNKEVSDADISQFPPELRAQIGGVMAWISDYFKKNTPPDTIPYTDYIKKSLHDYQFIQHNTFE
jgi:anthranilate/para-aminobenzoate synthase component II